MYLMSFGCQTSKNVKDIQKLFFRCTNVSLYGCLIFLCCLELKNNVVYPSIFKRNVKGKNIRVRLPEENPKGPQGVPKC